MMIKPNKLTWATCPHCKTVLNDWSAYPAELIMLSLRDGVEVICKGPYGGACGKRIIVKIESSIELKAEKLDGE